ncbi:TPA: hypothetical protein N0F65_007496 [Lagenidium giganteum]|uniref:PAS domain-containing protein n=1 Tax=Lagenidium giganteum TaxID=4803 RepID=A0AAV2ZIY2_9STRA|nr:TPA: hypothetical protein N0F65_007496 [Lagenidium giganteum]
MEFNDNDVDMAMHDDSMLDMNLAASFAMAPGGGAPGFPPTMVPGVAPMDPTAPQNFASVEEYAALMGIKLEIPNDDMAVSTPMAAPAVNQFNVTPTPDMAKIQANAAYFENLYRERVGLLDDLDNSGNLTSMTLPAGVGSGIGASNMFGHAPNPALSAPGMFGRSNELEFNGVNRMYDPANDFGAPGPMHMQKTPTAMAQRAVPSHHDLGAQTLSPEILSAMIKQQNAKSMHGFDSLNDDEQSALMKEEKSRERNRDHSRKSRLRKKEFVENLKVEVEKLQIYQMMCEQCLDLMALVTSEPSAVFLFTSSSYSRVLGYQSHQLLSGQSSFLDHVHPDNITEVRSIFQKFSKMGETKKFTFRIKAADGTYHRAETMARMAERGVVCSTRVDTGVECTTGSAGTAA